jgi:hypothetical protein
MNDQGNSELRDTLLLAGGLALTVMGAGLLMAHPFIRRTVLQNVTPLLPELGGRVQAGFGDVMPDVNRYLKMQGM